MTTVASTRRSPCSSTARTTTCASTAARRASCFTRRSSPNADEFDGFVSPSGSNARGVVSQVVTPWNSSKRRRHERLLDFQDRRNAQPSPSIWGDCPNTLLTDKGLGYFAHEEFLGNTQIRPFADGGVRHRRARRGLRHGRSSPPRPPKQGGYATLDHGGERQRCVAIFSPPREGRPQQRQQAVVRGSPGVRDALRWRLFLGIGEEAASVRDVIADNPSNSASRVSSPRAVIGFVRLRQASRHRLGRRHVRARTRAPSSRDRRAGVDRDPPRLPRWSSLTATTEVKLGSASTAVTRSCSTSTAIRSRRRRGLDLRSGQEHGGHLRREDGHREREVDLARLGSLRLPEPQLTLGTSVSGPPLPRCQSGEGGLRMFLGERDGRADKHADVRRPDPRSRPSSWASPTTGRAARRPPRSPRTHRISLCASGS
jgi:hypothetical protein